LCFALFISAATTDAAAKLEAGKKLYDAQKYDQAMDNFIDVFVTGNSQQIAEANEYVNLIHFKIGGVDTPKKTDYDPVVEQQRAALESQGRELFQNPTQQVSDNSQAVIDGNVQSNADIVGEVKTPASTVKEQIAPASAEQVQPIKETILPMPITQEQFTKETIVSVPTEQRTQTTNEAVKPPHSVVLSDSEIRSTRKEAIDSQVASMTKNLIDRLNKTQGVGVYMRGGEIDALDIRPDIIFNGDASFKSSGRPVLENIYALMLLNGAPSFILTPQGAYSDDASIKSVRQVIALNSYFINMGLSSAKISFNMGLTSEQPPAKFSNIEGIGIIFDYNVKPDLKRKLNDKDTPPILSVGFYPVNGVINPEKNEGMVIDFSAIETSAPVDNWSLQIIHMGKDKKYYIIRLISGQGAIYKQILWNGRKQYLGEVLPLGSYILVLKATDADGREKVIRRKVTLAGGKRLKTSPDAASLKEKSMNYKARRLWTKPNRIQKEATAAVSQTVTNDYTMSGGDASGINPYASSPDGYGAVNIPSYQPPQPPSQQDAGQSSDLNNIPYDDYE
jgi:hypothetical protein